MRLMRDRGVLQHYQHWSTMWMMMPDVAYRLAECLSEEIPSGEPGVPLLSDCFAAGAKVISRWPDSSSTVDLVKDAVRAMLGRALDAASLVVMVGNTEWRPRAHGPLMEFAKRSGYPAVTTLPRKVALSDSVRDLHALFEQVIYCTKCKITLRDTYRELMGVKG